MATVTAQLLIGNTHQNHGGIMPTHVAYLSENSRPAWTLIPLAPRDSAPHAIVWAPTVDHMLEDALLMIAVHVLQEPAIIARLQAATGKTDIARLELNADLASAERQALYGQCRALAQSPALVLTVLPGSTILPQLPVLTSYTMDVHVCRPVYSRHASAWSQDIQTTGSLA